MSLNVTSTIVKKVKITSDDDTGEVFDIETDYVAYDINWVKVQTTPLFEILSKLSESQLKVACFVFCTTGQKTNMLNCSALKISNNINVCEEIVQETFRILFKNDILRKIDRSTYMINPQIMYYGKSNEDLLKRYKLIESEYEKDYDDYWYKLWINNFMPITHGLSGKCLKVMELLIKEMDCKNQVKITQKEIVAKTKLSLQTVNRIMKSLKEKEFFVKHEGVYLVNPEIVSKVSHSKRLTIRDEFQQIQHYYDRKKNNQHITSGYVGAQQYYLHFYIRFLQLK